MKTLIINEELKNLLPPLSADEYTGLETSLLKDGCLSDLVVWNDILVDGHNRLEICQKHEIPYGIKNVELDSLDAAKLWAWQNQENRRNLTAFHRGELALKLKDVIAAKAKERQLGGLKQNAVPQNSAERAETRQELSQLADVSHDTLNRIEYISEHADEETKAKLRNGEKGTSINKEYNRLKEESKSKVQPEIAESDETCDTASIREIPFPNKDIKFVPHTTLKNIPQDSPQVLLANLFAHFRKGFVEDLVVMAMEKIEEKLGKVAAQKILRTLQKRLGK